jgi:hypothetical protein
MNGSCRDYFKRTRKDLVTFQLIEKENLSLKVVQVLTECVIKSRSLIKRSFEAEIRAA